MELATNLFNKGILLDTHPMVQGNDTLTDCLNGTLVTMNGNEVILLNDMGNRRVDNAFLPSGYEPVGVKEYGGIIYIAAYNPITNKSLIGSFPSPLKKIDSLDDPNLSGNFDFNSFLTGSNVETDSYLGIPIIKSDSFMVPLTKDISLRAGDKFAIYATGLSSMKSQLTNYDNIYRNKAYSPKNRKYTLLIGILNSLNEFVDITKTLCRWELKDGRWVPKNYDTEKSEVFKFNDGYFISDDFTDKLSGSTIEDSKLIRKRQKMAANTYAYKLIGPMYLNAILNHIENFNYNIYGTAEKSGSSYNATLWIEGYINYNCPDGASTSVSNSNENYSTFEEGTPNFLVFDLIGESPIDVIRDSNTYIQNNNIYLFKIVKKYTNIYANEGNNLYNYVLGVLADKDTSSIYLKGLSVKGQIDLSLLGSGKVFINGWRFYNNLLKQSTSLTFSFNAYPEYGKKFGNLRFKFRDVKDNKEFYYPREENGLPLYNGRQTYTIDWSESLNYLEPRKIYEVTATYDIINSSTGAKESTRNLSDSDKDKSGNVVKRWLLTTELFNEFYQPSANIPDYCDLTKSDDEDAKENFLNKMKVNVKGESTLVDSSEYEESQEGGLATSDSSKNIRYVYNHKHKVNINSNPLLNIIDENLYPDFIKIPELKKGSLSIDTVSPKSLGNVESPSDLKATFKSILKSNIVEGLSVTEGVGGTRYRFDSESNNLLNVDIRISSSNNKSVVGEISYKNIYVGHNDNPVSNIENAFDKLSNIIEDALPSDNHYCGIAVNFDYGGKDDHYIDVVKFWTETKDSLPSDSDLDDKCERVAEGSKNGLYNFFFGKLQELIYSAFNSSLYNAGQMFLYMYLGGDLYFPLNRDNQDDRRYPGGSYTRLWWRTSEGEWATFNELLNVKGRSNVKNKIIGDNGLLKHDYIYCMYPNYMGDGDYKIYAADLDFIYYNQYSIPLIYNIKYKLVGLLRDIITIPNNLSIGNLKFESGELEELDENTITFNLNSSLKFNDEINTFNPDTILNIDLGSGLLVDSLGRKLNPNYVYYYKDNKLIRLNNNYLAVDTHNMLHGKNTLVYNRYSISQPKNPYQAANGGEGYTVLVYNAVNVIQEV